MSEEAVSAWATWGAIAFCPNQIPLTKPSKTIKLTGVTAIEIADLMRLVGTSDRLRLRNEMAENIFKSQRLYFCIATILSLVIVSFGHLCPR
jgi:hypothetical protein